MLKAKLQKKVLQYLQSYTYDVLIFTVTIADSNKLVTFKKNLNSYQKEAQKLKKKG